MDDVYFDWRSHILANRNENERFSLLELLDSIPTDIPRNASEFDEEIRNLIISLYSDAKETSQQSNGIEKEEYSIGSKAFRDTNLDKHDAETKGGNYALEELSQDLNNTNIQTHHPETRLLYDFNVSNTKNSTGISKTQFEERTQGDTNDTVTQPLGHSTIGEHIEYEGFQTNSDSRLGASLVMQYDQHELEILHDKGKGGLSNEITKDCPLQDSIDTKGPASIKQDGIRQEFEADIDRYSRLEQQLSVESQNGDFQKNLDDLGDGKTAAILNSVTGWFTKISSDPSKDLLGSVSLLEDLPSEPVLDTDSRERILLPEKSDSMKHGMNSLRYEIEDKFSLPSETSKLDDSMRQHSLSVIEEENDNFMYEVAGKELPTSHSDLPLLNSSLAHCDSGFGSLFVLNPQDEIPSTFNVNGHEPNSNVTSDTNWPSTELLVPCDAFSQRKTQVDMDDDVDTVITQLEQKLESVGKFDKKKREKLTEKSIDGFEQLSADYNRLLKEKMALKKLIWDLEENLSFEKKTVEVNQVEKSDILNQKTEIEAAVLELEEKVKGFEVECKIRDGKLKELVEKLTDMNKCYEKLKEQSEKTEKELKLKGDELEKTKSELSGYLSACSTANQSKEKCELQLKLLSEAFQKMKQGKDWLEFQLKTLSESRAKMQLDFEESRAEQNSKASAVLELQAENKNLSAKLVEMNFANGKEKNEILKGMEKVEDQILEYQTFFAELESKNETLLHLLKEKESVIDTDGVKIKELISTVSDAEATAEELRAEICEKEKLLDSLRQDFNVVKLKLEEYEELIKMREEERVSLSSKNAELEERSLELGSKVVDKENELSRIVEENTSLEKQLEAANDEKNEFENAVLLLKKDMQKVNLIFQVMKKDLASKSSMLLAIDKKKEELLKEMKDLQDFMSDQSHMQEELRTTLRQKIDIIGELSSQKEKLADEVKMLKDQCSSLKTELDNAIRAREALELDSHNTKRLWMVEEEKLQKEISSLVEDRDSMVAENAKKEQRLVAMKEESNIVASNLEQLKKKSQMELANLRAKENKLSVKLREVQKEWQKKEENYESSILSLVNKLKNESIARQNVDKMVAEQSELMTKNKYEQQLIFGKVKEIFKCFNSIKDEKDVIKRELLQFKDSSSKLYGFLVSIVNRMCRQIEESADSNEGLISEVEELKAELNKSSRGADILRSQVESERRRADDFENKCEKKEVEIRNLKKQIAVLKKEKDVGHMKLSKYKKNSEGKIHENEDIIVGCRKQIEALQNEKSLLYDRFKMMEKHLTRLTDETKEKDLKITALEISVNESTVADKAEQEEKSMLTAAYNELQGVIFSLENQLSIEKSQTKVLEDQIRNLKWQCKQAKSEATTKKEELELVKLQHETEVRNITSLLNVAKMELSSLRDENSEIRREKQKCSGQLIESQERLRRQGGFLEKLQDEVRKRNGELMRLKEDMKDCKSAATREILDFVVKKAVINVSNGKETENKKPKMELTALQTLRRCMAGLRNEVDSLHSEMSSQMDHLQGSKTKIKKFQENLGGLQNACKSLHEKSSNIRPKEDE